VADEIKEATGLDSELIKSKGGVFDITADGKLIFSKANEFRFPKDGEAAELVKGV